SAKITAAYVHQPLITLRSPSLRTAPSASLFIAVEAYLSDACARGARRLKAELGKDSKNIQVSQQSKANVISIYPGEEERRFYRVVFHKRHHDLVIDSYLPFILGECRNVTVKNRQLALPLHQQQLEPLPGQKERLEAIIDDLMAFQKSKEYYAKVGKAWKRGYLLYGPPGTGKSTMIAAMANFLDYDVYDLELTAIKNNTELRKLFIETTGKSIIEKKAAGDKDSDDNDKAKLPMEPEKDDETKVTLSGLLNFIDGLWSACGGERIIIFTTNHKEKLDPALIRRGRMDKHIEMSYCRFESFKVLAKNNLDIRPTADVAENLMPMSKKKKRDPDVCLAGLIEVLKQAKEDAAAAKAKRRVRSSAHLAATPCHR
ncbi:hypothetical protein ZWY2020_025920, partial [Hordeum vulgare]